MAWIRFPTQQVETLWNSFTRVLPRSICPYTVMLALVVLYWLLYIVGVVSEDALDFMDFDADVDVDVDVDADVDIDADVDVGSGGAHPLAAFLHFFHVGDVPVILIFSVLVVFMWTASMLATHFLGIQLFWVAVAMFPAILIVGLIATKALIMPFAPYLKTLLKQTGDTVEVIGKTCTIVSLEATHKIRPGRDANTRRTAVVECEDPGRSDASQRRRGCGLRSRQGRQHVFNRQVRH